MSSLIYKGLTHWALFLALVASAAYVTVRSFTLVSQNGGTTAQEQALAALAGLVILMFGLLLYLTINYPVVDGIIGGIFRVIVAALAVTVSTGMAIVFLAA